MDLGSRWWTKASDLLTGAPQAHVVDGQSLHTIDQRGVRVPIDGRTLEVSMGPGKLQITPDFTIEPASRRMPPDLLVYRPERYLGNIGRFARLAEGEVLTVDPVARGPGEHYSHPGDALRCSIQLRHHGDSLVIKPTPDPECRVRAVDAGPEDNAVLLRRRQALEGIRAQADRLAPPASTERAMERLQAANAMLAHDPCRPANSDGRPGGIVEVPAGQVPIIVGDLHGRAENLLTALSHNGIWEGLEQGSATLIMLGDAVHPDEGAFDDMESSVGVMDLIIGLKLLFPERVHMLLGNHDSFSGEIMKSGVPQGMLWDRQLTRRRGVAYRDEMQRFYESCPLLVVSDGFVACHAGAPRMNYSRQMLLDVRSHAALLHELTWNRQKTPGHAGGYTREDVDRLRHVLSLGPDATFVVGHYPRSETETIWMNAGNVSRHHVVISSRRDRVGVGVVVRVEGEFVAQTFAPEPIADDLLGWGEAASASAPAASAASGLGQR